MPGSLLAALALASAAATAPVPATSVPSLDALLRRPSYEDVQISPDGSALAIAYRDDDGMAITVVDRTTHEPMARIDTGARGEIAALAWLGSHRLLIAASRDVKRYGMPLTGPTLYLTSLDKKHPKSLPANFMGTIDGDDDHLVVSDYSGAVRLVDIDHVTGSGKLLAEGPKDASQFMANHAGKVRFAWGWDENERGRLYVRTAEASWKSINDSDTSHVEVIPLGISRDNRTAFFETEHADGTDGIESYDFASGKRQALLRDPVSDPLSIILSLDQREPIGAWFGPGRPHAEYWNPGTADAKWHRALANAFPDSIVTVTSASRDGSLLVIRTSSDRDGGSFYLLDRATHKMQLLFHSRPWLDPAQLAPTTPFTMQARDGVTLRGFVTMPVNDVRPAPMVVIVHGGPYYVRDSWGFDPETQLLATHGYAVLRVNFRGSGGFGLPFVERGFRQWGAKMQDDITDGTRWAIDHGLADPRRICIYGASYGGYAALMGVAREPTLYRCAIGLSGVYDLDKLYHWGDIHRSDLGLKYLANVLGHDKSELVARSPSALAAHIAVPVLLVHGELDGRVPVKYAHEMRKAMKKAGHPVEYVEYPWEGHGLARPDDRKDFYTRLLRFLDAHIGAHIGAPPAAATSIAVAP